MVWKITRVGLMYSTILLLLLLSCRLPAQQEVRITFLNVGEGEATLVQAANKVLLIDAGNVMSARAILQYLAVHKIDTIDHLIITHPHLDHMSGVFHLLQTVTSEPTATRFDIKKIEIC